MLPRERWQFDADGCSVQLSGGVDQGIYDAIYHATNSPVAGLGLAAIRDFASYLKYGSKDGTLREDPALVQRVIGFGYSQSGRFLREFVRDGFNGDEKGRAVFDGLMISSAGAAAASRRPRRPTKPAPRISKMFVWSSLPSSQAITSPCASWIRNWEF